VKIEVTATEREVFIRFNGVTHFRIDRRELIGLQSWQVDRGRVTPVYAIEFLTRSSAAPVILEYDKREKWIDVLTQLDGVPFLNEFKVQDP
jgi:hypothetical protein